MSRRSQAKARGTRDGTLSLSPVNGALIAYYATVTLIFVASMWPHARVWGLNWWAYFPDWVRFALFITALLLPILGRLVSRKLPRSDVSNTAFWWLAGAVSAIFIVLFVLLRAKTHFLGDGYTLIGLLAAEQPLIKYREIGESLVHLWVRDFYGGADPVAALYAYQTVSILAGALFVGSAAYVSKRLFANRQSAVTFLLGVLCGGYMLLYFGYVENYSLFVLSVAWYTWTGMFACNDRVKRWWILLPQAAAIACHIFGVSLLPATVYCLLRNSSLQAKWKLAKKNVRRSIVAGTVIVIAAVLTYFYTTDLFFRIAILPLVAHEFTIEGYTLLSGNHVLDLINLVLLLMPGTFVFLAAVSIRRSSFQWQKGAARFLLLMLCSSLAAVIVFDPKIGMPRDWDLFSFMGIPLLSLVFYSLLDRKSPLIAPAWLIIGLGLLVLIPRSASQTEESVAMAHALAYKELDQVKNRQFYTTLTNYCRAKELDSLGASLTDEMHRRFPERAMGDEAHRLVLAGKLREAIALSGRILKRNPFYHGVWANMGTAYLYSGNYDSAIACYEVAAALNPGRAELYGNTGAAYLELGKLDKAAGLLRKAIDRDSTEPSYVYNMGHVARARGDIDTYHQLLAKAALMPKGYPTYRLEYLALLMQAGQVDQARGVLKLIREQIVDVAFLDSLYTVYPQLRE